MSPEQFYIDQHGHATEYLSKDAVLTLLRSYIQHLSQQPDLAPQYEEMPRYQVVMEKKMP